jgi:RimJ/RimL family protein N-acetyltransferase
MNNILELKTEHLILRPINIKDANAIFKYRSDKLTNQYQGWIPNNIDDVYEFIKKTAKDFNIADSWFQMVLINKETNVLIGDIGIHFLDKENKQVEIGCTIAKDQQGKGYATEALRKVIDYLFSILNKHRVIGSVDPNNVQSIKMLERLGFRKEAHFKESILANGQWTDDIIYAILKKEWR